MKETKQSKENVEKSFEEQRVLCPFCNKPVHIDEAVIETEKGKKGLKISHVKCRMRGNVIKMKETKITKENVEKYSLIIECNTFELAERVGKLVVDEVPEIRRFKIK